MPAKRDQRTTPPKTADNGSRPKHTRRPQRPAGPGPGGSIQAGEVLTLAELKRRLGWGEHAVRQARRAGLRLIPFGREKFALGSDVLAFFTRLGEQQPGPDGQPREADG
ncbi:MAG TPA: hypothetical protein VMY37_05605 [Thermoguttaceae bacterium]|nr:hypothetical protein [Thermoguttaceae bacterium]